MKILVIDDEPKAREYMRSGLTESGYVVMSRATATKSCLWPRNTITT